MYYLRCNYQINQIYQQRNSCQLDEHHDTIAVYRGQLISRTDFEFLCQLQNKIISIHGFLSTTTSFQIAHCFLNAWTTGKDMVPVIFCIQVNQALDYIRPYGDISQFSVFPDEEEILFCMGSIFRVGNIESLDHMSDVSVIHLTALSIQEMDTYGICNRIKD